MYRNAMEALTKSLEMLLKEGMPVKARGGTYTLELQGHYIRMQRPLERVYVLPERNNNVFAALAETWWVLSGRDDLDYLSHYLPRAGDFSDDGKTWRGAYGPRLHSWNGVDQIREVVRLLAADQNTRRCSMMIFDPARDFIESKDIPCNNWLHFLVREGKLHLCVALRSNDAIWGFSGINTFEWSMLQQLMAFWVGVEVGTMTFLVSSFHLYQHHFERAQKIVDAAPIKTLYDFDFRTPQFSVPLEKFDDVMKEFFTFESEIRKNTQDIDAKIDRVEDNLVRTSLQMLRVYNLYLQHASGEEIMQKLDSVQISDLRVAGIEFLTRQKYLKGKEWLRLRPEEKRFFDFYF